VVIVVINLCLLGACGLLNITTEVIWKDADGTVLKIEQSWANESLPEYALPADTDIWDYTYWSEEKEANSITYTANRTPQKSYFAGNVFQIVTKDLYENPIATGTGFVYNSKGYFITNSHVMEGAYYATAIFEIRNDALSESFTKLEIEYVAYDNPDKDIFIGKISNYNLISDYFKDITFVDEHEIGEKTYSIGYPSTSVNMQINEGLITENLSTLYDKLYSGVSYIGSQVLLPPEVAAVY